MMEGISGEAASLAGHLKLSNLCWIYDNNKITIEGHTEWAFSEDVATRFIAYGWNVTRVGDANDLEMLERAFNTFKKEQERPTLIIVDSHIAWGSPNKQDTHAAHGEPLGEEEIKLTKRNYGWPEDAKFLVPDGVREHFAAGMGARGKELRTKWMALFEQYRGKYPDLADQGFRMQRRELPDGWDKNLTPYPADPKGAAGRDVSGKVLNTLAQNVPWLLGGSADLAPSTKTRLTFEGAGDFSAARLRRAQLPLRHPRARHGRHPERAGAVQDPRLRLGLHDLQRLHAGADPPGRHHGDPDHLHLHPRLHRRGRGRPHAPAHRAPGLAARHPRPHHAAAGRRQRGGRGVEGHHAAQARAGGADPLAPGHADARPREVRRGRRAWPRAPTCWPTRRAASPT